VNIVGEISNLVRQTRTELDKNFVSAIDGFSGAFGWFQGTFLKITRKSYFQEIRNLTQQKVSSPNSKTLECIFGIEFESTILKKIRKLKSGKSRKRLTKFSGSKFFFLLIVEFNFRQLMAFASSENLPVSNEPRQPKIEAKKEPVKKLEGKKWIIENGEGNWDLQVEMDQRVHIISSTG
jgi:hypothetical protein